MPVSENFLLFEDTETTGTVPGEDQVIEIASILCDLKGKEVSRFHEKIQFDHVKMKPEAAAKNGYDPKVWGFEAVPFYKYDAWLMKNIPYPGVAIPVGHYAKFDRDMIELQHYKPMGKFFKWAFRCIDTAGLAMVMKVAGVIDVPDIKLATVAEALKLKPTGDLHRAMVDCELAKGIFDFSVGVFQS